MLLHRPSCFYVLRKLFYLFFDNNTFNNLCKYKAARKFENARNMLTSSLLQSEKLTPLIATNG